jgi:hypothetical protein
MPDYSKTLELYEQLQKNGAVDAAVSPQSFSKPRQPEFVSGNIDQLNEAVFGKLKDNDSPKDVSQSVLIETMREVKNGTMTDETRERIANNVRNLKIPAAIIESVISNPLVETKVGNDEIDDFAQKLLKKNKNIEASTKIIEELNKRDNKNTNQINEVNTPRVTSEIDYDRIASLVESAVEKKFNEMAGRLFLNESRNGNTTSPNMKCVQMKENSRILFVDTDDNVYEMTMVYKGKNRRK